MLGKPPGLFHQREGSPRRRAAGFHEPLAANPRPHGSVYPGTEEPINHSPELARRAWLFSPLQPQQRGWDSLPGQGGGPPPGHGCQAWLVHGHCLAGLWGRCPHPCVPRASSKPFCSHQLSSAVLGPHTASLERLRVIRAQGSWGPISATTRPESRSQPKGKGPQALLGACHHSQLAPPKR